MTTLKDYPYYSAETVQDIKQQLRDICNIRKDDITQIQQLPDILFRARKVARIPTSSADVIAGDRVGDINYTVDYLYILIDNSGTAVWRRAALSSW